MKKVVTVTLIAAIVLIALVGCNSNQTTIAGKNKPAPTTITSANKPATAAKLITSYAYSLTASATKTDEISITMKTTPSKTVMTIGNSKPIIDPVLYKYYQAGIFAVQCQSKRGVLFINHGKNEVQVYVLPIDTSPQKPKNISVGNKKCWVEPGTTDITYNYRYRTKSADGKRLYEIVQEGVESTDSTKVPPLFASAVRSFKEVR